jgi:hypothetical protein
MRHLEDLGDCGFTGRDLVSRADVEKMSTGPLHLGRGPQVCAVGVEDLDTWPIRLIDDPHQPIEPDGKAVHINETALGKSDASLVTTVVSGKDEAGGMAREAGGNEKGGGADES